MTTERKRLTVTRQEAGLRLDQFLPRRAPELPRGALRRVLETQDGAILVGGRLAKQGRRLREGEVVEVSTAVLRTKPVPRGDLPLDIVAIEDAFVVVNKPAGIHAHPLTPGEADTLAGRLIQRFPECLRASPQAREGGLVHRLDLGTSGLQVAARSRASYLQLRSLFASGQVQKEYLALVAGPLTEPGQVAAEVEAVPGDSRRVRLAAGHSTRPLPRTRFAPLLQLGPYSLISASCSTGRRHQVRAHLASRGHPLVDDPLYGGPPATPSVAERPVESARPPWAFLHAWRLRWDGRSYSAPLPPQRQLWLRRLALAHECGDDPLPGCEAELTSAGTRE